MQVENTHMHLCYILPVIYESYNKWQLTTQTLKSFWVQFM